MKRFIVCLMAVLICSVGHGATRVPGTKVSLNPPDGFTATTQFPGFVMESTSASIMVTEIPGPFSEFSKGATKEGLATRGVIVHERTAQRISNQDGFLIRANQIAEGVDFLKWMLVFGNEENSVMVLATYPAQLEAELGDKLKASVLSTTWDLEAKVDFYEGLTFRVKEFGDMKIAKKVGNSLLLTPGAKFPQPDRGAPFAVVGSSITEDWQVPGDKMDYTRDRLIQTKDLTDVVLTAETNVTLNGLEACVMEAEAMDSESGKAMYVLHCLIFTTDGYYIFQGFVDSSLQEKYSPIFLDILKSFKRA